MAVRRVPHVFSHAHYAISRSLESAGVFNGVRIRYVAKIESAEPSVTRTFSFKVGHTIIFVLADFSGAIRTSAGGTGSSSVTSGFIGCCG